MVISLPVGWADGMVSPQSGNPFRAINRARVDPRFPDSEP